LVRQFSAVPLDFHVTDEFHLHFQKHLSIHVHPIFTIEHCYSNSHSDYEHRLIITYLCANLPSPISTPSLPVSRFHYVYAQLIHVNFPSTRAFVHFITAIFAHLFLQYLFAFDMYQHFKLLLVFTITSFYFFIHSIMIISLLS
jgi:hypothetical protein